MDLQSVGAESLINLLAYDHSWPNWEQHARNKQALVCSAIGCKATHHLVLPLTRRTSSVLTYKAFSEHTQISG